MSTLPNSPEPFFREVEEAPASITFMKDEPVRGARAMAGRTTRRYNATVLLDPERTHGQDVLHEY